MSTSKSAEMELTTMEEKEKINIQESTQVNILNSSTKEEGQKQYYWRWTLCTLTVPFMLIGFPTHLIFGFDFPPKAPQKRIIRTPLKWLKEIFNPKKQNIVYLLLSLIIFGIGGTLTSYVVYSLSIIFYDLIVLGDLTPNIAFGAYDLVRTIPGVIPVLFGWLRGYSVQSFINSFDTTRVELKEEIDSGGHEDIDKYLRTFGRKRKTRKALFWLYFAIVSAQILHMVAEKFTGTGIWIDHAVDVFHNAVLPIYCGFCWALASEYEILANHLELLHLNERAPTFEIFVKIKTCFKKVVSHVQAVNGIFQLFICWVIILALLSIVGKVLFATIFLFGVGAVKTVLFAGLSIFGKFMKGIDIDGDGKGDAHGLTTNITEIEQVLSAPIVRTAIAYYISSIIQILAVYYTIMQAQAVNDRARYLQVLLNDYASQVANQMTPELYNSFRLLKFYMHSTNEQQKSGLLKIPILGVLPPMKDRLQGYTLKS